MAVAKTASKPRSDNGRGKLAKTNSRPPSIFSSSSKTKSPFENEMRDFFDSFRQEKLSQVLSVAKSETVTIKGKKVTRKKVAATVPAGTIMGLGTNGEKMLMQALGWYWEPLKWDLGFYKEMRNNVTLISGEIQKLVDVAMDGFEIHCEDPEREKDLKKSLLRNRDVAFRDVVRRAMVDGYSLGNYYEMPIWGKDKKGRKIVTKFKPIPASVMRILRDEDLAVEGFVQLLHRPVELMFGVPATPTVYRKDQIIFGRMRQEDWSPYGVPILASLPFPLKIKLQMERELAETLHQHVPRIKITYTPEEQLDKDQVDEFKNKIKSEIADLKPSDNLITTPDIKVDYIGPMGKGMDFQGPQKHMEQQLMYIFPFGAALMGLDNQSQPLDAQGRWTIACIIAGSLRTFAEETFAPTLDIIADEWNLPDGITMSWSPLDPMRVQQNAEAEEYVVNNAGIKRDQGFIDQDTAARQATIMHKGGPVKKAAAPGPIPPPVDPNVIDPKTKKPYKRPGNGTNKNKVNKQGPKKDGTKAPARDRRPKGKRHGEDAPKFKSKALKEFRKLVRAAEATFFNEAPGEGDEE